MNKPWVFQGFMMIHVEELDQFVAVAVFEVSGCNEDNINQPPKTKTAAGEQLE